MNYRSGYGEALYFWEESLKEECGGKRKMLGSSLVCKTYELPGIWGDRVPQDCIVSPATVLGTSVASIGVTCTHCLDGALQERNPRL